MMEFRSGVIGIARLRAMRLALGAVLSAAILVSCKGLLDIPVPEDGRACSTEVYLGVFRGRASGASTDTLMGCAYFTTDTLSLQFGMVMTQGGPLSHETMMKVFRVALPVAGKKYAFGAGSMTGVVFLGPKTFVINSGTFETTSDSFQPSAFAAARYLEGTIDMTATDTTGAVITVKGSFKAVCVGDEVNSSVGAGGDVVHKRIPACEPRAAGLRAQ